jgi:hypothetical protein
MVRQQIWMARGSTHHALVGASADERARSANEVKPRKAVVSVERPIVLLDAGQDVDQRHRRIGALHAFSPLAAP